MKKAILIVFALFCTIRTTYAQWTNSTDIYNTNTGNVGIGTSSPASLFSVGSLSQFQVNTLGLTSLTNIAPEFRFINSADGSFARFLRGKTSSNNFFAGKNQVAQAGGLGACLNFNASAFQYVDVPLTNLPSTGSNFSLSFWFKTTVNTNNGCIQVGVAASGQMQIGFGYQGDQVYTSGWANGSYAFTQAGLNDNNWHNIIITVSTDGTNSVVSSYLDGSLRNTLTAFGIVLVPNNNAFKIGYAQSIITGNPYYFTGSIDSVLGWARVLTTSEIAAIYYGGIGTATPPAGQLFRYEFDEGTGTTTADINDSATPQTASLYNSPTWNNAGIVPLPSTPSEVTYFSSTDGVTNSEKGIATWGDFNGRNQQQGKWFQWFQGSHYPLVSDNNGHWLFNPNNTSTTLPTIASTVDVAGNLTIGSGYAGVNAAPANGLLVQGNVGIGTTSPTNALTVGDGNTTNSGRAKVVINTANANTNALLISNWIGSGTSYGPKIAFDNSTQSSWIMGGSDGTNNFDIARTWGTPDLRINGQGDVSIGTTDPRGFKLAVNGSAIAESMTVQLHANWPDYVFKPSYALPTLTEVKTYIDKNQHLPEMPSEQEIAEKGLNLGEMNKLLVKKVEELTLYLIEKDTENKDLKQQMAQFQQQLADIQNQLRQQQVNK